MGRFFLKGLFNISYSPDRFSFRSHSHNSNWWGYHAPSQHDVGRTYDVGAGDDFHTTGGDGTFVNGMFRTSKRIWLQGLRYGRSDRIAG